MAAFAAASASALAAAAAAGGVVAGAAAAVFLSLAFVSLFLLQTLLAALRVCFRAPHEEAVQTVASMRQRQQQREAEGRRSSV